MTNTEHSLTEEMNDSSAFDGFFSLFTDRVVRRHLLVYVLIVLATAVAQNFRPAEPTPEPTIITYNP